LDLSTIKGIDICYENCEVFRVDSSYLKYISFSDAKTKYDVKRFPNRYKVVSGLEISISSLADRVGALWLEDDRKPFNRTETYPDIVYINVEYKNGVKEIIYPPWDGDDYTNKNQSSRIDNNGNLLIRILKAKKE